VRLDNDALRDHLLDRIERADEGTLSPVEGRARRVTHDAQGSLVHRADGPPIRASVAVDATGYPGTFVRRTGQREPGVQVAYGFTATFDRPPFETGVEHHTQSPPARHGGAMVLMDFDDAHLAKAPRRSAWKKREVATFLYAMGEGNGRDFFVEETSLVARPAIDYELLEERLHRRLRAAGLDYEDVRDEEFCRIPMGAELPDRDQRALAFGAAASMVHPASGYMIARMLGAAAPLAAEIDAALRRGLAPERVAARAWRRLWPEEAVRRRALYTYGMEVLLDLDAGATRRFFDAFFDLEEGRRRRYLAGTADPREVATMMLELFGSSSNALRWRLARPALGSAGTQLLRALSAR
jgi:lycopene beta-cyclase